MNTVKNPPFLDQALATMSLIRKEVYCVDNTAAQQMDKPFIFSTPSIGLYAHAWNWDSAFHILGNAYLDPDFSLAELKSLLDRQLPNGMIGHILYGEDKQQVYFPPVRFWNTRCGSSDITQTPVLCAMVEQSMNVVRHLHPQKYPAYVSEIQTLIPALEKFHVFFRTHRDPLGIGGTSVAHPWENGTDNAPANLIHMRTIHTSDADRAWAHEKEAISNKDVGAGERPPTAYYAKVHAVTKNVFSDQNGDVDAVNNDAIGAFCLYDPLVHSLLLYAELALYRLASRFSLTDTMQRTGQRITTLFAGLEVLWNEHKKRYDFIEGNKVLDAARCSPADFRKLNAFAKKSYVDQHRLDVDTIACYLPLILLSYDAELKDLGLHIPHERQESLLDSLRTHGYFEADLCGLPSASPHYTNDYYRSLYTVEDAGYSPMQYHRGPVWIHTNHLLQKALLSPASSSAQARRYAQKIQDDLFRLVENSGMREYFDPETQKGLGAYYFGFTAALCIDVYFDRMAKDPTALQDLQNELKKKQRLTEAVRIRLQEKELLQSLQNQDAKLQGFGLEGNRVIFAFNPNYVTDNNEEDFDAARVTAALLELPPALLEDVHLEQRRSNKVYIVSLVFSELFSQQLLA